MVLLRLRYTILSAYIVKYLITTRDKTQAYNVLESYDGNDANDDAESSWWWSRTTRWSSSANGNARNGNDG